MEIIFKTETRDYKAIAEDIEDIYEALKDGLVAMSYAKSTAQDVIEGVRGDLKNE